MYRQSNSESDLKAGRLFENKLHFHIFDLAPGRESLQSVLQKPLPQS